MDSETIENIRKRYPSRITRGRAIKLYCKTCCCAGDTTSWKDCTQKSCFLWVFRLGRETLGNTSSFKKGKRNHRQNASFLGKSSIPAEGTGSPFIQNKIVEVGK